MAELHDTFITLSYRPTFVIILGRTAAKSVDCCNANDEKYQNEDCL